MPTRELTPLLSLPSAMDTPKSLLSERLFQLTFATIQWPWLLRSLYGGSKADKASLLQRLDLPPDALHHLGSWKPDTYLLHRLVALVEEGKPQCVVELGSGASTLVLAKALERAGTEGALISFDQHASFINSMNGWLAEHGTSAEIRHAPLSVRTSGWPGPWYSLDEMPSKIDLLLTDGPP